VHTFRTDARLSALRLSTEYLEPLFSTGGARIAKNVKIMMRRSLNMEMVEEFRRLQRKKVELEKENSF